MFHCLRFLCLVFLTGFSSFLTPLQIFVADNQGDDDQTRIDKLELFGNALDGTDVSQLKKGEDDHEH